jgi:hypothetical protein
MSKQDIIDEIAENLGYVHSIINNIKAIKQPSDKVVSTATELDALALYCDCYLERCFEKLIELSE